MRSGEQQRAEHWEGSDARGAGFDLEAIEAAYRAMRGSGGTIAGIQICLPTPSRKPADLTLDRIVNRWATSFALPTRVEHDDEMTVVRVEREPSQDTR